MDNKPKFDRAAGQRDTASRPLPDFVPMMAGAAVVSGLLFALFRHLRNSGIPFSDFFSAVTRAVINPVLSLAPEALQQRLLVSLATEGEQVAFGIWLCVLAIAIVLLPLAPSPRSFRRRMGLEALIRSHASRTPRVRPILRCDPRADTDPDGPWAPPITHEEWAARQGLNPGLAGGDFPAGRLEELMLRQLRLHSPGGTDLTRLCVQALQAVCVERIVNGRAAGNALIDELASSFSYCQLSHYRQLQKGGSVSLLRWRIWQLAPFARHPGLPWHRPRSWIRMRIGAYPRLPCERIIHRAWAKARRDGVELLAEARRRHAFASTRCIWLLIQARARSGVLEPSALLWIKPVCRVLWSAIHQTGLNCANIESAGIAAHYIVETEAGKALSEPRFDALLWGLRQALWPDESTVI